MCINMTYSRLVPTRADSYKIYAPDCVPVNNSISEKSRLNKWKPTDYNEMHVFLGVLLWMGLDRKPSLQSYWSRSVLYQSRATQYMTRDRFELLLRMWHFSNNEICPEGSRLHKVQYLIDILVKKYKAVITPDIALCIDETMIPFRGRLNFRQYVKGKRHKFGIKVFKLCLQGGYTYNLKIYCDKGELITDSVPTSAVMFLMDGLLEKGRILYTDNWYTSTTLARKLLDKSTHLVGTLRRNRKYIPKTVVNAKIKKGELTGLQTKEGISVMKWKDKREVLFLSTLHTDTQEEIRHREGIKKKPSAIVAYNAAKSFIDVSDQKSSYSSAVRRSIKWYRKVAVEVILGTSVINSLYLYNKINESKISITNFRENLCHQLFEYGPKKVTVKEIIITHSFDRIFNVFPMFLTNKIKEFTCI